MLQALFGRQLEQLQTIQLGRELALNVRLTELALERYPPHLVAELTGLDLEVAVRPSLLHCSIGSFQTSGGCPAATALSAVVALSDGATGSGGQGRKAGVDRIDFPAGADLVAGGCAVDDALAA